MPSILRMPGLVSSGICNRAVGDRHNRATATGPPGAGLRDRTPTTPNAVRRACAAGTRLRRARTSGGLPGSVVNARSSRPRPAGERRQPLLSQGGAPCGARRGTPNPAGLRGIGPRGDVRSPGDGFGTSLPATVRSFRIAIFQDSRVHQRAEMAVHQTPPVHGEPAGEVPGGGPFANPAGFENQVPKIRGQRTSQKDIPEGHPRRTLRPGRETACR